MLRIDSPGGLGVVALLVGSLAAGCAGPRARTAPAPLAKPLPAPQPPAAEAPPATAPAAPPTPSIGAREPAGELPPRAEAPPTPPPVLPPPPPPTVPPVAPGQRGRFVVLNFDNADVETVIHAASEIVGFNYVLAPDVRGKVTVQTAGRIPQEDVFGVLLAILEVHGFTAVKAGNLYKILKIEGARERAVPTIIGPEPDPQRATDEIITQIVPVRYVSVTDLNTLLRPLISARGNLAAHRETNILMVTDSASNIRRLLDIVRLVDVEVALDELQIIPLKFADSADLAAVLTQLFASGRLRRSDSPGAPPAPAAPAPPARPGVTTPPRAPGAPAPAEAGAERAPLIIAERRSNSLIVYARKLELETIRRLVNQLDVNIYGGRRVFIYYAENAKSKDLAATLNAIYGGSDATPQSTGTSPTTSRPAGTPPPPPPPPRPGGAAGAGGAVGGVVGLLEGEVRFIGDEVTNSIIVTTLPRNWPEIEATIKQLDRQPRQVLIEVMVAEVTLTDDIRLGLDWAIKTGSFRFAQQSINPDDPVIASPSPNISVPAAGGTVLGLPAGGLTAFAFSTNEFFAILNALASDSRINVLSNPHVMTSENKKAVINVSDSIPIVTSQQVPIGGTTTTPPTNGTSAIVGTQSVEYRDAGVILTVTPRIGERGTVALDVKQEVNDIGGAEPPTGSRRIIKREAETSVVLVNNQTLVLGGLIRDRRSVEDRGIPFLKNIPVLGYLFGAKVNTSTKTELLILITPRVIGTALDAARVTEQMRRSAPNMEDTFRLSPRPLAPLPPPGAPPLPPPPSPGPTAP
jgi:general secretion pathway protein D